MLIIGRGDHMPLTTGMWGYGVVVIGGVWLAVLVTEKIVNPTKAKAANVIAAKINLWLLLTILLGSRRVPLSDMPRGTLSTITASYHS